MAITVMKLCLSIIFRNRYEFADLPPGAQPEKL
ncbi:hypothetical protein V22_14200 [Calycomorphotria hydatis]|uniref:Uncharacterized protein n=1 Tax=Calycomorphotria hydatis TaxID=2528027 RepID=A0A517T753_9PLAN|nr:hypothetical protein V22_14200 [Calycomorphotria hydatis]